MITDAAFLHELAYVLELHKHQYCFFDNPKDCRGWDRKRWTHLNFFSLVGVSLDPGNVILFCVWHLLVSMLSKTNLSAYPSIDESVTSWRPRTPIALDSEFSETSCEQAGDNRSFILGLGPKFYQFF